MQHLLEGMAPLLDCAQWHSQINMIICSQLAVAMEPYILIFLPVLWLITASLLAILSEWLQKVF